MEKPKRVLTEAQRLAFLKGREKRMANLEKKRLEKEEALFEEKQHENETSQETISQTQPQMPPPKPKLRRTTKKERVDNLEPVSVSVEETHVEEEVPDLPKPDEIQAEPPSKSFGDQDLDEIANRVAEKVMKQMQSKPRNQIKTTEQKQKQINKVKEITPVPKPQYFTWI